MHTKILLPAPRITHRAQACRRAPLTTPADAEADTQPRAKASERSSFEESQRRRPKLSEGRRNRGGVADDSIGRRNRGGVADDSIGRRNRGGVADDSIGVAAFDPAAADEWQRDQLVPDEDLERRALRENIFLQLETPRSTQEPSPGSPAALESHTPTVRDSVPHSTAESILRPAKSSSEAAARLDVLLRGTAGTEPRIRATLLTAFARDPNGDIGAVVAHAAGSPALRRLGPRDQERLARLLLTLDLAATRSLGTLLENTPALLGEVDARGQTLLENLERLASQPLGELFVTPNARAELMASALREIINPNRIDQGSAPTCTVTSMQFELVSDAPAEYLRLIADLASPAATATMRGGGKLLLETTDVAPEARHGRSVSQAMFQSAAMEYGNGRRADFDPVLGLTTDARGHLSGGLGPPEQTKVLKALFGVYYRTETFMTEAQGRQALAALRGFDTAAHSNRPVIIELDQGQNNHAVTLERVADGRVVYRDPYGTLRSMPEALFPQFVVAIHLPPEVSLD